MKITVAMLRAVAACPEQIAIFAAEWPKGGEVTLVNCRRAVALGLDLDFAAWHLLGAEAQRVYDAARAEAQRVYEAARAEAQRVYYAAMAEPRRVYEAATAEAFYESANMQG